MTNENYLARRRKEWALSQQQVADLIGIRSRSVISSYEREKSFPTLRSALAYQFIFGTPLAKIYPKLVGEIEEEVMRSALELDEAHRDRRDATAARVREFLQQLLDRAGSAHGV